jgi:hypothetical protein
MPTVVFFVVEEFVNHKGHEATPRRKSSEAMSSSYSAKSFATTFRVSSMLRDDRCAC